MKKQIITSIIVVIILGIIAFQVYEIHSIKTTLENDQEAIVVGAQGAVNTWNFIYQSNQATSTKK